MADDQIKRVEEIPTAQEYIALRDALGWGQITKDEAQRTFNATTYCVCLRDRGNLVGLIRIVGDGVLYIFIADVMVHPDYGRQGFGDAVMRSAVQTLTWFTFANRAPVRPAADHRR